MKLIEKYIEWLVVLAVVLITTITFVKALMSTLDLQIINGCIKYLSFLILYFLFLYQKYAYGIKIFDKFFFYFYLVYCLYIFLDITIFQIYPLDIMLAIPESIFDYMFKFVISIGYLLCAKTIVVHFNLKKYLLLSVIICTIPSIMFIQAVGIETIQAGISEDEEGYIGSLGVTYANMPILVLAVMNFRNLFSKKVISMIVCSCIIAAVLYILFAYGKRGPMLWSFVSIFFCFLIQSKKYIKSA